MRILTLAIALAFATTATANIGRIKTADSGVKITRGTQKIDAKPGVTLEAGDVITTPVNGKAGMTFIDNSRVALSRGTVITVEKFEFNDTTHQGNFIVYLAKGSVAVVSGHISRNGAKSMLIRTPKSLYALRDARMVVRVK